MDRSAWTIGYVITVYQSVGIVVHAVVTNFSRKRLGLGDERLTTEQEINQVKVSVHGAGAIKVCSDLPCGWQNRCFYDVISIFQSIDLPRLRLRKTTDLHPETSCFALQQGFEHTSKMDECAGRGEATLHR